MTSLAISHVNRLDGCGALIGSLDKRKCLEIVVSGRCRFFVLPQALNPVALDREHALLDVMPRLGRPWQKCWSDISGLYTLWRGNDHLIALAEPNGAVTPVDLDERFGKRLSCKASGIAAVHDGG